MPDQGVPVELGLSADGEATHTFAVVQQRHARLLKRLFGKTGIFRSMEEFTDLAQSVSPPDREDGEPQEENEAPTGDAAAAMFENLIHAAEGKLYDLFTVFIPNLMPRWEFEGYGSEGHYERDEYVEELDRSPSVPQMVTAFETAVQVNGLRWVRKLSGFFDSKMLKAEMNLAISRLFREARERMDTIPSSEAREIPTSGNSSPKSPQENGASAPTSSGTTDQTRSEPSESEAVASASPSPDS